MTTTLAAPEQARARRPDAVPVCVERDGVRVFRERSDPLILAVPSRPTAPPAPPP